MALERKLYIKDFKLNDVGLCFGLKVDIDNKKQNQIPISFRDRKKTYQNSDKIVG